MRWPYDAVEMTCITVVVAATLQMAIRFIREVVKEAQGKIPVRRHFNGFFANYLKVIAACCLICVYSNYHTIDRHGKLRWDYPSEVADAFWQRGFTNLWNDKPIPSVCLQDIPKIRSHP